jgi:hypothetical protein
MDLFFLVLKLFNGNSISFEPVLIEDRFVISLCSFVGGRLIKKEIKIEEINEDIMEYATEVLIDRKYADMVTSMTKNEVISNIIRKSIDFRRKSEALIPIGDFELCPYSSMMSQIKYFGMVKNESIFGYNKKLTDIVNPKGLALFPYSNWLKFEYYGKTLFIAQKPLKYETSWESLYKLDLAYGREVMINENKFIVRLMTGGDSALTTMPGGEWNDLFYGLHEDTNLYNWNINMRNSDFYIGSQYFQKGRASLMQETEFGSSFIVVRGLLGIMDLHFYGSDFSDVTCGWRPVLELVD